ncbi:unnamed protein product [Rotaria magnacalcarata]|uniref:Uncharacterized protein n=1 Tax=Rotaria magnacalcarata TaxID=392030 RepID=A0A816NSA6_9BILA|nr:unnamed protein product [Rotaria magnacalcarata]
MSQHSQRAYEQIYGGGYGEPQQHHKSSFTHELIAGGAGFAAMKTFEDHARSRGAGSYGGPPPYSGPGAYCGPPSYGGPGQYGGAGAYGNN